MLHIGAACGLLEIVLLALGGAVIRIVGFLLSYSAL